MLQISREASENRRGTETWDICRSNTSIPAASIACSGVSPRSRWRSASCFTAGHSNAANKNAGVTGLSSRRRWSVFAIAWVTSFAPGPSGSAAMFLALSANRYLNRS